MKKSSSSPVLRGAVPQARSFASALAAAPAEPQPTRAEASAIAEATRRLEEEAAAETARQAKSFCEALQETQARMQAALDSWCRQAEAELGAVAIDIAEKVLRMQLSVNRASVRELARDAVSQVTHASRARIRVNPMDIPVLNEHKSELLRCAQSLRDIELVDDPELLGGAVIETDGGAIDASVNGKLAALREELEAA